MSTTDHPADRTAPPASPAPESPAPGPRRRGRKLLGFTLVFVVALGAFAWFLPSMLSASWMHGTVLSWLNRDPDRRIEFADLDLSWKDGMRLEGLSVRDLRGGGTEPFFTAEAVALDVQWRPLLDKKIIVDEFTVRGSVLDLTKPSGNAAPSEKPPQLPEGTFGLSAARVPVVLDDAVVKLAKGDIRIEHATMMVRVEGGVLVVDPIDADVNDGTVTGSARIGLEGASPAHVLDLHAKDVELDEYLAPVGAMVLPLLAGDPKEGTTSGKAGLDLHMEASGRRVDELKSSLRGTGTAALNDVALEAKTWLTQFLTALGRPTDGMKLDPVAMPFRVGDGRVTVDESEVKSSEFVAKLGGTVTLDGQLDYRMRVKPTAGAALFEKYATVLDPEGYLPIRLTGSVTAPKTGLPGVADILERVATDADLQGRAADAIGGLLGGKDDKPEPETKPRKKKDKPKTAETPTPPAGTPAEPPRQAK